MNDDREKQWKALFLAQADYIALLGKEIESLASFAVVRGWSSKLAGDGDLLRAAIERCRIELGV